ncbi:MAG: aminotransferase class I/II-fold pyridoxal phosphate-dependent enzyme [Robiginitalea sp.]
MNFSSEAIPGTEIQKDGKSYLYFGGTSYLGMQRDPEFLKLMSEGMRRLGTHWGASRVGNVTLPVYQRAEAALASWMGSPACLTLSSGFLAARLVAEYFFRRHTCFFSPNCHEALLPPGSTRQPDWESLARTLETYLVQPGAGPPVVFTDSMGGPGRPGPVWDLLEELPKKCILVADDSHGIGISGPDGSGSWKALDAMGFKELVVCGSLGKAMGVTAGFAAGTAQRLAQLEKTPFFAGASPAPPTGLSTLTKALESGMYQKKWQRLNARVKFLQDRIGSLDLLMFQKAYPVLGFRNRRLAQFLLERNILITDFEYPAEGDALSYSRIVITAAHQETQLQYLAAVLKEFRNS